MTTEQDFKKFCNSLRCPLCGSQLDGNIKPQLARLYCCNNNDEYKVEWGRNSKFPDFETIKYWYPQYQYTINISKLFNNEYYITIDRYNMDAAPDKRYETAVEMLDYTGPRISIFNKRMEENIFLNKLKTFKTFY